MRPRTLPQKDPALIPRNLVADCDASLVEISWDPATQHGWQKPRKLHCLLFLPRPPRNGEKTFLSEWMTKKRPILGQKAVMEWISEKTKAKMDPRSFIQLVVKPCLNNPPIKYVVCAAMQWRLFQGARRGQNAQK
jgi:hypothetical protein